MLYHQKLTHRKRRRSNPCRSCCACFGRARQVPETRSAVILERRVLRRITFLFVVWRKGCMHTEHFLFIAEMLTLSCDFAPPPCASFMARSRFCAALAPLPPPMSFVCASQGLEMKLMPFGRPADVMIDCGVGRLNQKKSTLQGQGSRRKEISLAAAWNHRQDPG